MKRIATLAVFSLSAILLLGSIAGQGADNRKRFGLSDPDAPIDITADRLDADQKAMTLLYSGNAVVHQGDVFLHTDSLRVVAAAGGKTADKIFANGHVVVSSLSGTATGETAVYDVSPRVVTLTGDVVLTRDDNVMRGKVLKVDLVTGLARLDGGATIAAEKTAVAGVDKAGGDKVGRIQGMFMPRSFKADDKQTDKPGETAGGAPVGKNADKPADKTSGKN